MSISVRAIINELYPVIMAVCLTITYSRARRDGDWSTFRWMAALGILIRLATG